MLNKKEASEKLDTHLGSESKTKGDLTCTGGLRVDGDFDGNINVRGLLIVGKGGKVKVNEAKVKDAVIAGNFEGKLWAENRVELEKGANFKGEINCKILVIEEGVTFNGSCSMGKEITPKPELPKKT
jgi:cytoskeletal protein CcmA (bactofilin family)